MRAILLSKAAKSRSTSSRNWRRSSSCFWRSVSRGTSSEDEGGGVGSLLGVETREPGVKRRLVMRLKGFSSTFRRRDLWSSSSSRCSSIRNEDIVKVFVCC